MPNNDSHQHVVKTSSQWNERAVEFWVIPRGCLCIELTPEGKTKLKIGEGNKYYSQLPYITDDTDLSDYYTKEEIENILDNLNRMAIMSTDEYDSKSDLPLEGNKLGDVRFVKSSSPSVTIDPDIYLWNGIKWIYVGNQFPDIDLSKYLKKTEFHEMFDPVKERVDDIGPKVDEMYPIRHTHTNKSILDNTTASYTSEEKIKLAGLHNYDIEISDLQSKAHIHDNKTFLDTITQEYQIWSQEDRYKFDHIKNYDQDIAEIRVDIQTLESKAHTHANKNILDQTTASFTVEDKTKLDSLHNDEPFVGTTGLYPGVEGNVPAPKVTDVGKFLSSDGSWKLIGNEGVLDITQDDPDALNELTVHFRESDKVITVPAGGSTQYVRVSTNDSFVLLHTKPADWDDTWYKYYMLSYDELVDEPPDWDPTQHYKYENDNYVLGSPGDTFVSTTWYDKHYNGLDPNTPIIFDSDVYYTNTLNLIQDGELFDTAFEKVNEAIEHIERLEQNVQFLHDNKVDVRTTSDPERVEFYYS